MATSKQLFLKTKSYGLKNSIHNYATATAMRKVVVKNGTGMLNGAATGVGKFSFPLMEKTKGIDIQPIEKKINTANPEVEVKPTLFEEEMKGIGIDPAKCARNASVARLYEDAVNNEEGTVFTDTGALAVSSGKKTGRCPNDKRVVHEEEHPEVTDNVWWGKVNMKLSDDSFMMNKERAVDYLNTLEQVYVIDAYAGWDPEHRMKVRVISSRPYHALFMKNMLVIPPKEDLDDFSPDFTIFNAGKFPCNKRTQGMTSSSSVALHFRRQEMVILGTEYAGEMKKGVFTLMNHYMPKKGQLPLHSSANVGADGDVAMFFGLSGTGKTTLSADPERKLIGDDEHVWTDNGVFNIEGGCYAKAIGLDKEKEPDIYNAIRYGTVLENVVVNDETRAVEYENAKYTENTRAAYPLHFIPNALIPAKVDTHPKNIILLTCDAFGVLPPVAKLTPEQVQYYFIQGYTAKVAGTEMGINEPVATFSACFGAPFLVWHPAVYAEMLAQKMDEHKCDAWLLNTGWTGGGVGVGSRMSLNFTRKMVDAIFSGELKESEYDTMPVFDLNIPRSLRGVPDSILSPRRAWGNPSAYDEQLVKLAHLFKSNMHEYDDRVSEGVKAAGPFFNVPQLPDLHASRSSS
jgi:phosphoenolpyruvate carboxykinase (ATP)